MTQYRAYAKLVAIIDLVLSKILMLTVIVVAILAGTAAAKDTNLQNKVRQMSGADYSATGFISASIWILCAVVAVSAVLTALQMWAAIGLMKSTEIGREPVQALRLATTWNNISVVFCILQVIGMLFAGTYIPVAVNLLLRGGMIYVVFRYMKELEMMRTLVPV